MEILNLVQGSDEWLDARLNYLCASEAPAMMGDSKFMSRNQLLDLKKGWESNPHPSFRQKIFDKGHLHEKMARDLWEIENLISIPPVVIQTKVKGLSVNLLASFDGLEDGKAGSLVWEHKDWNLTLAENIRNGVLDPLYYWQLEHQLLVNGSDTAVIVCSDGGIDNRVYMTYNSIPARRVQLIEGWKLFLKDLKAHTLEAKKEKTLPVAIATLPKVVVKVEGSKVISNISECLTEISQMAELEKSKILECDQDFANKDKLNKDTKKAREALKETVASVRSEFSEYAKFENTADELDTILQKMQSHGEKLVKTEKENKKTAVKNAAITELQAFVKKLDVKLRPLFTVSGIAGDTYVDWEGAMRGLKTITSIESAIDKALNDEKQRINLIMVNALPNVKCFYAIDSKYGHLFNDSLSILTLEPSLFSEMVESRIANYEAEEKKRLDDEREAIRLEEEAKAKDKAEKEAESLREKIRLEEEAKASEKLKAEQAARAYTEEPMTATKTPDNLVSINTKKEPAWPRPQSVSSPQYSSAMISPQATAQQIAIDEALYSLVSQTNIGYQAASAVVKLIAEGKITNVFLQH